MRKIPKAERYTLGQKTFDYLLEIVTCIAKAEYFSSSEKIVALTRANQTLDVVKIMVRLTHDLALIEEWTYIEVEEKLFEISKMLGGWIRSLKSPPRAEGTKRNQQ